jgi:hypothetical protein
MMVTTITILNITEMDRIQKYSVNTAFFAFFYVLVCYWTVIKFFLTLIISSFFFVNKVALNNNGFYKKH